MLSREDNELLTRVGPGTAMGALMRRYWIPVLQSSELQAGGRVKRVMLLGERLIRKMTDGPQGGNGFVSLHRFSSRSYAAIIPSQSGSRQAHS